MTVTTESNRQTLAQAWIRALSDVDAFAALCAPDCQVWHSHDDRWVTVQEAVDVVHKVGGLPAFTGARHTLSDNGFFVQATTEFVVAGQTMTLHVVQIVEVRDGKAVRVQEYIGPEMALVTA